jgi:hypothetical protein
VSDSNPSVLLERTSLIVYEADIFNCSRHTILASETHSRDCPSSRVSCPTVVMRNQRAGPHGGSALYFRCAQHGA